VAVVRHGIGRRTPAKKQEQGDLPEAEKEDRRARIWFWVKDYYGTLRADALCKGSTTDPGSVGQGSNRCGALVANEIFGAVGLGDYDEKLLRGFLSCAGLEEPA